MNIRKTILYLFICSIALWSCKGNKTKDLLLGTWRSQKIDNPAIDDFFAKSQLYIDTVGKGNDAATNIELYGVANIDSMRTVLQQQYDSAKMMQAMADTQTLFKFEKDSIVSLVFPDRAEGGKWYLDTDGALVLVGALENGETETTKVEIVTLNETTLKLKFLKVDTDVTDTSYVTFRKEGK